MPVRRDAARPEPAAALGPRRGWAARIRLWIAAATERDALARLDARLLRDIGVTREAAHREAARPFWDIDRP